VVTKRYGREEYKKLLKVWCGQKKCKEKEGELLASE